MLRVAFPAWWGTVCGRWKQSLDLSVSPRVSHGRDMLFQGFQSTPVFLCKHQFTDDGNLLFNRFRRGLGL